MVEHARSALPGALRPYYMVCPNEAVSDSYSFLIDADASLLKRHGALS